MDKQSVKQYCFDISLPPKTGILKNETGEFIEYDTPNGELTTRKQFSIEIKNPLF
jgi:hypothetical protein